MKRGWGWGQNFLVNWGRRISISGKLSIYRSGGNFFPRVCFHQQYIIGGITNVVERMGFGKKIDMGCGGVVIKVTHFLTNP